MVTVAAPTLSTVWRASAAVLQTYAAVGVAFACWFLNTIVAGWYVAIFQPSGLTLWTLAVAGWCGVFSAHKASAYLFPRHDERVLFVLFVFASGISPLLGYLDHVSALEHVGRLAQMLATIATAYTVFLHPENNPFADASSEIR